MVLNGHGHLITLLVMAKHFRKISVNLRLPLIFFISVNLCLPPIFFNFP